MVTKFFLFLIIALLCTKSYSMSESILDKIRRQIASIQDRMEEDVYGMPRIENLKRREGFRGKVYKDTEGYPTIGYGHKLTADEIKSGKYKAGLTKEEAEELLRKDVVKHDKEAMELAEERGIEWNLMTEPQQDAMKDMVYQLGKGSASKFKNTLKAVAEGRYEDAAEGAGKSLWAKQTPKRVKDFQRRINDPKRKELDKMRGYREEYEKRNPVQIPDEMPENNLLRQLRERIKREA